MGPVHTPFIQPGKEELSYPDTTTRSRLVAPRHSLGANVSDGMSTTASDLDHDSSGDGHLFASTSSLFSSPLKSNAALDDVRGTASASSSSMDVQLLPQQQQQPLMDGPMTKSVRRKTGPDRVRFTLETSPAAVHEQLPRSRPLASHLSGKTFKPSTDGTVGRPVRVRTSSCNQSYNPYCDHLIAESGSLLPGTVITTTATTTTAEMDGAFKGFVTASKQWSVLPHGCSSSQNNLFVPEHHPLTGQFLGAANCAV